MKIFTLVISMVLLAKMHGEEMLDLDVLSYSDLLQEDAVSLHILEKALLEKGIVGVRGIPDYMESVCDFIEASRNFNKLPDAVKEKYAPNRELGELFLGYESGKEKFQRPDGTWVVDNLKVSYYAYVPDRPENKWPHEVDLRTSFQKLGSVMSQIGGFILDKLGIIGNKTGIQSSDVFTVGRMLYYRNAQENVDNNPFWCGAHYDHGMFTALVPSFYFSHDEEIPEPFDAGLFVNCNGSFKKVDAKDHDILLFQVGEFGQLITNDAIMATQHRVHKAQGDLERYTMALFFSPAMDTRIHSTSVLAQDTRYGDAADGCTYAHWEEETFKRFIVKESQKDL